MFNRDPSDNKLDSLGHISPRRDFRNEYSSKSNQYLLLFHFFPILLLFVLSACSSEETPESTDAGPDLTAEFRTTQAELRVLGTETAAAALTGEAETAATVTAEREREISQAAERAMETVKAQQAAEEAEETAIAQETADAQATVDAAATIDAAIQATSTAIFQETKDAYETTKLNFLLDVYDGEPFVLPISGTLALDDIDIPSTFTTGVDLENFVVQSCFVCRGSDANCGKFGYLIRQDSDRSLQLTVGWAGDWMLQFNSGEAKEQIQNGHISQIVDQEEIELTLYIEDTQGYFFLNDEFVADLDLSQLTAHGDLAVINAPTEISAGVLTPLDFQELIIWSMDPIPPTPVPVPTSAEPAPPPEQDDSSIPRPPEGMSRLVIINETIDRGVTVRLWTCCEDILIGAPFAETVVKTLPEGEYGWEVSSGNCMRGLPQLFLRNEIDTVLFVIPQEGGCGFYLSLYTGEE